MIPRLTTAIVGLALASLASSAAAEDVDIDAVPAAVRATIEREVRDGAVTEIDRETDNGRTYYEVEFTQDHRKYEIHVAPDGRLLRRKPD